MGNAKSATKAGPAIGRGSSGKYKVAAEPVEDIQLQRQSSDLSSQGDVRRKGSKTSGRGSSKEQDFSKKGSKDSNDSGKATAATAYHRKHCSDCDLHLVRTINEAYPYKDSDRKIATRQERVWNPMGDGVRHDWGDVSVAKLQKRINCCNCKQFILDRYDEMPFIFCVRCRNQDDRHFELCIECYNNGACATGPRDKVTIAQECQTRQDSFGGQKMISESTRPRFSPRENLYRANSKRGSTIVVASIKPKQCPGGCGFQTTGLHSTHCCGSCAVQGGSHGAQCERRPLAMAGQAGQMQAARSLAARLDEPRSRDDEEKKGSKGSLGGRVNGPSGGLGGRPEIQMPSGLWKGRITEGASARDVSFRLNIESTGTISGSGPDNCEVNGSYDKQARIKQVTWTERHAWGSLTMTATLEDKGALVNLKGTFTASDGGGGKIELVSAKK